MNRVIKNMLLADFVLFNFINSCPLSIQYYWVIFWDNIGEKIGNLVKLCYIRKILCMVNWPMDDRSYISS